MIRQERKGVCEPAEGKCRRSLPMKREAALLTALLFFSGSTTSVSTSGEVVRSLGPGSGVLDISGSRDLPCAGNLFINSDQGYDNGCQWHGMGVAPPYYGAFAECFIAPQENWVVCGTVFDLTVVYVEQCPHYTLDAYVWDDDGGIPGNVLAVVTGFDPYPIAQWPDVR